jgi:rod shape-determining protein MreB
MFKAFRKFFSDALAIDLGTVNTLIYEAGEGIVLNEPSLLAVRNGPNRFTKTGDIAAIGTHAKRMLGRTPEDITAARPVRDGMIADFILTERMLQFFIQHIHRERLLRPSSRMLVCVRCGSTQVERRVIREAAIAAGARDVFLIEEPLAAAIGAEIPIGEPRGSMVIDMGGGTTQVAVLSLNGIVHGISLRMGGDYLNKSITNFVRRKFRVLIGESTAEYVKHELGSAYPVEEVKELEVGGHHLADGMPCSLVLNTQEIHEVLRLPLQAVTDAVRRVLDQTPPELGVDVRRRGIVVTGGGALLQGVGDRLTKDLGIHTFVAEDPLTCVARGAGRALELFDKKGVNLFTQA